LLFINTAIDSVIHETETKNLYVIGSGGTHPNPSELISSERTGLIFDLLKQKFDCIIIDTPPVLSATDAMLMAALTDATLLVVRAGHTNKKIISEVVERFEIAKLPILGVLLNRVNFKENGFYYRHHKKHYSNCYNNKNYRMPSSGW